MKIKELIEILEKKDSEQEITIRGIDIQGVTEFISSGDVKPKDSITIDIDKDWIILDKGCKVSEI